MALRFTLMFGPPRILIPALPAPATGRPRNQNHGCRATRKEWPLSLGLHRDDDQSDVDLAVRIVGVVKRHSPLVSDSSSGSFELSVIL